MVRTLRSVFVLVSLSLLLASGCKDSSNSLAEKSGLNQSLSKSYPGQKTAAVTAEGFETGTKTAYAAADVTLGSGGWNLNDALIGTSTSDIKNGTASARIRNSGTVTMKFDRTTGAGTVTIKHAKYGSDAATTWTLWYSINSGSTWTQTGSTITTSATTLQTATFTVNVAGIIRFEIRKTDASTNRTNIDDISISDYTTTNNPIPVATTLNPSSALTGSASFTLAVTGNSFISTSVVKWNGTSLTTAYVSATQLNATVPAANLTTAGSATVTVFTPTPGGGTSSGLTFSIYTASSNVNLIMGNPSGATVNVNYPANYLLNKTQFAASYNRDKGIANWVSWQLNSSWCNGSGVRKDNFIPDATLPSGWYQVTTSDYTGSGFSRGHMCPSGDRINTQANNDAVFVMTNMIPQNQTNNSGPWEALETYCRTLANAGNVLYIISGGYGSGGTGTNGYAATIAGGKVTVPAKTWKVIIILPAGTNDVSRVTTSTRTIAVIMNNDNGPFNSWGTYRVTVDSIESLTGYDFFSNVSTSIQAVIESKIDSGPTQ